MISCRELGSKVEMRSAPGMNLLDLIAAHTGAASVIEQSLVLQYETVSSQTSKFRIALINTKLSPE